MQTKTLSIILIAAGIIMMIYTGFNYITTENVVDLGPLQINKEKSHPVNWSPVVGVVLLLGGVILLISDKKAKI